MKKILLLLLAFAASTFAQQTSVAVLPSDGTVLNNDELEALTDKMRESALKILPTSSFILLKQDVVVKRLGGAEKYIKECSESSCIVDLGKKAQVDYVSQASVGKLGNKIRIKIELYSVRTEGLMGMLSDEAEDVSGLLALVEKRAPEVFSKLLDQPGEPKAGDSKASAAEQQIPTTVSSNNQNTAAKPEPDIVVPEPKEASTPVVETWLEPKAPTSFLVGIGLNLLGAVAIGYAIYEEGEMKKAHDEYSKSWQDQDFYNDAYEKAENHRDRRNLFYIIGGVLFASGIGVHIWF